MWHFIPLLLLSLWLFGCKSHKAAEKETKVTTTEAVQQEVKSTYHMVVTFKSIGMGIDRDTKAAFDAYLNKKGIKPEVYHWGREGESDCCIDLSAFDEKERNLILNDLRDLLQNGKWIDVSEGVECLRKNR